VHSVTEWDAVSLWVEQYHFHRVVLREWGVPDGVNIGLIEQTVRFSLDHGYDVLLEGVLDAGRYGTMLQRPAVDHAGTTRHYYFDIPFQDTLDRHTTRPLAAEVTPEQMRAWYRPRDLLEFTDQQIVDETSTLASTVDRILTDLAWTSSASAGNSLNAPAQR